LSGWKVDNFKHCITACIYKKYLEKMKEKMFDNIIIISRFITAFTRAQTRLQGVIIQQIAVKIFALTIPQILYT
jgi:hypothetical protein